MPLRPLLLALLSALAVVALTTGPASPALADTSSPQCVTSGGALVAAPAGVADGAPCPASDQQSSSTAQDPAPAPAPEPAPDPQPQPAPQSEQPAQAPAPDQASTPDPATDEPVAGTPEAQPTEQNPTKSKSQSKVEHKHRKRVPDRKRSGRERSTGPDDSAPPPPPASLLDDGPGLSPAAAGTGGDLSAGSSSSGPISLPAPLTQGVPNILLDSFRIPPFLLPIYQAAGVQYGVRWEILAGINAIETDYGRNLSVSTAGAVGWMQFMPGTWETYGVDANGDGRRDPYNPVDAIFAAARYLKAAGAGQSLRRAIFAYNHADWYVDDVLERAKQLSALPADVVASLSGLTLGRFPIAAPATYAGRLQTKGHAALEAGDTNASIPVESSATRRGMRIYAAAGAPVVAVQDSRVISMGVSERLGRYIRLRDAYGNTYTYGHLAKLATRYPVPRERTQSLRSIRSELGLDGRDPRPTAAATRAGGHRAHTALADDGATPERPASGVTIDGRPAREVAIRHIRVALGLALPDLTRNRTDSGEVTTPTPSAAVTGEDGAGSEPVVIPQLPVLHPEIGASIPEPAQATTTPSTPTTSAAEDDTIPVPAGVTAFRAYFAEPKALDRRDVVLKRLRRGAHVIGGTVLGRIGAASLRWSSASDAGDARAARASATRLHVTRSPHVLFEVRPAGERTPRVDPKPLLDGWRLLDSTNIFRARNPLVGDDAAKKKLSIGQIMLMSKEQLMRHVLENPDISIYECGRADIRAGIIDRRVLATLEFLVARGMKPTVTSLNCGHGFLTASGNVSEHSSGNAVDIAAINGTPIVGHQGAGSITDKAVRMLLTLQGTMKPHQIITLMQYAGTDNTFAMADHYDHIHVGFHPNGDAQSVLKPGQWDRLLSGLGQVKNPVVPVQASRYAIKVTRSAPARARSSSRRGGRAQTRAGPRARDG